MGGEEGTRYEEFAVTSLLTLDSQYRCCSAHRDGFNVDNR